MKDRYYFAYGSNMNLEQMKYRCPAAEVVENVRLEDYRLAFRGKAPGNGVATVLHQGGDHGGLVLQAALVALALDDGVGGGALPAQLCLGQLAQLGGGDGLRGPDQVQKTVVGQGEGRGRFHGTYLQSNVLDNVSLTD